MEKIATKAQEVEKSINKKLRAKLWTKFIHALKDYKLVEENDKIAVCVSGGKDSMLLAVLMQMLQRYSDTKFDLVFICMDPGYNEINRKNIEENAKKLEIPLKFFNSNIFDTVFELDEGSPCYLCARMRRGYLYNEAKKYGCNKIALAHHLDDVIETTLMGMFHSAQLQGMLPKVRSRNFEGMELIRPLYCVRERDIISWRDANELTFIQCACRFTEQCAERGQEEPVSMRQETKKLISSLEKEYPNIANHIFRALHNVNVDTFPAYKQGGKSYDFNDIYEK